MAKRIAKFHKVSFEQFRDGYLDAVGAGSEEEIRRIYDEIRLRRGMISMRLFRSC